MKRNYKDILSATLRQPVCRFSGDDAGTILSISEPSLIACANGLKFYYFPNTHVYFKPKRAAWQC